MSKHDDIIGTRKPPSTMHKPTPRNRAMVRQMARVGIPRPYIAKEIGIGLETLGRHYSRELEQADVQALTKVLNSLYRKALAGEPWAVDRFLGGRMNSHQWLRDDWSQSKKDTEAVEAPPINIHLDTVGAISALLNQIKRGDPLPEPPVLIEQKDDDD